MALSRQNWSLGAWPVERLSTWSVSAVDELEKWFPKLEQWLLGALMEVVAVPQIAMQQLLCLAALRTGLMAIGVLHGGWRTLVERITPHGRRRRALRQEMVEAPSYSEWRRAAAELDRHEGTHLWRHDEQSPYYDAISLQRRIKDLDRLVAQGDTFSLIFRLRGGLSRTQFGLCHEGLFNQAFSGTKVLARDYQRAVVRALDAICGPDPRPLNGAPSSSAPGTPTSAARIVNASTSAAGAEGAIRATGAAALPHGGVPRTSRSISSSSDSAEATSPDSSKRDAWDNLVRQSQSDALEGARSENTAIDAATSATRGREYGNGHGDKEHEDDDEAGEEEESIPTDVKLAFFNETRHAYGRTALMLSGGAALGFYHIGLIRCLLQERLLPRVVSGSSAGSIMAAVVGTHTDAELRRVLEDQEDMRTDMIKPNGPALRSALFQWASGVYTTRGIEGFYRPRRFAQQNAGSKRPSRRSFFWQGFGIGSMPSPSPSPSLSSSSTPFSSSQQHATTTSFEDISEAERAAQKQLWPPLVGMFLFGLFKHPLTPMRGLVCDTQHLASSLRHNCGGDLTFQEAFDRTGRIINIVVSPTNRTDPPRLLNYLTAPHVVVWSAATASSAVPGIFEPQALLVKDLDGTVRVGSSGGYHSDGSVEADLPMAQLSELFNVNHFIVSQVNPHGVALSSMSSRVGVWGTVVLRTSEFSVLHKGVAALAVFLQAQLRAWGLGVLRLVGLFMGHASSRPSRAIGAAASFITQQYEGRAGLDVSILPWNGELSLLSASLRLMDSPKVEDVRRMAMVSERNTWPKLPRIHAHCDVEVALERCVQRLRHRLAAESAAAAQEAFRLREAALDEEAARLHAQAQARALALAQDPSTTATNDNDQSTGVLQPGPLIPPPAPFPATPLPAAAAASSNMGSSSGSCGGQETWGPASQPLQETQQDVRGDHFAQATTSYQEGQPMGGETDGPTAAPPLPTGVPGARASPGELARVALTLQAGFSVADRRASDAMPSFGFGLDDDDDDNEGVGGGGSINDDDDDDEYGVGLDVNDASDDDEAGEASSGALGGGTMRSRGRGRSTSDLGVQGIDAGSSLLPPFKNSSAGKPRSRSNSADSADAGLWYRGATTTENSGSGGSSRSGRARNRTTPAKGRRGNYENDDGGVETPPPPRDQAEERIAASTGQMASFYYQRQRRPSAQSPRSHSATRLGGGRGPSGSSARGGSAGVDTEEDAGARQRAANARTWAPGDFGNSVEGVHPPVNAEMFEEPHGP